jgi:hypothetical protein
VGAHLEVLQHRHLGEDLAPFRAHRDAAAHDGVAGQTVDALAFELDASGTHGHQAADALQRGALAGAVGPDQRHAFGGVDHEADAVQHVGLAVTGPQVAHLQHQCAPPR